MSERLIQKGYRFPESLVAQIDAVRERASAAAGVEVKEVSVVVKALELGLAEMERRQRSKAR